MNNCSVPILLQTMIARKNKIQGNQQCIPPPPTAPHPLTEVGVELVMF